VAQTGLQTLNSKNHDRMGLRERDKGERKVQIAHKPMCMNASKAVAGVKIPQLKDLRRF
jgi:hypothetical protein